MRNKLARSDCAASCFAAHRAACSSSSGRNSDGGSVGAVGSGDRRRPRRGGVRQAVHARPPIPGPAEHPLHRVGRGAGPDRLRVPAATDGRRRVRRRLGGATSRASSSPSTRSRFREPGHGPRPISRRPGGARRRGRRALGGRSAHATPSHLPGKGGTGEQAVPIAALTNQNKNGNAAFATDGTRYAFGFDVVPATAGRQQREPRRRRAWPTTRQMQADGCTVLYVGTATFKGGTTATPSCTPTHRARLAADVGELPASASSRRRRTSTARTPTTIRPSRSPTRSTSAASPFQANTVRDRRRSPSTPITRSGRASSTTRPRTSISSRRAWSARRRRRRRRSRSR